MVGDRRRVAGCRVSCAAVVASCLLAAACSSSNQARTPETRQPPATTEVTSVDDGVLEVGVLLPSGLGLKIDQIDVGRAGFVRCLPNGCVAEVVMDDNLLKQLRGGQTATFIIFQTPEEGIGFPMNLKGFGEGFDKLS